ncbi:NAD-dependent epimerase/dehydratase family protein [Vibrio lentus]
MKKVLITGANGLLARHFIRCFHQEFQITALSRSEIAHPLKDVNYVVTNYSADALLTQFYDQDAVVHLAASRLYSVGVEACQQNVLLDEIVFETAHQAGVSKLLFASTRGVYGTSLAPWSESSSIAPNNVYALAKGQSEVLAQYYVHAKGLQITTLRLAQIYSSEEFKGSMLNTFFERARNGIDLDVSVIEGQREYIYIKDAISAMQRVLMVDAPAGIYNLGSEETQSIEQIASIIAKSYDNGVKSRLSSNPTFSRELSLMDSSKFRNMFDWYPLFSFESATKDIVSKTGKYE